MESSDIALENYLIEIQPDIYPEYLTEGLREFIAKFDRKKLKKSIEKLHLGINKDDKNALKDFSREIVSIKKIPKFKEMESYKENIHGDHPEVEQSSNFSEKVIKNTFKIKDKAKLSVMGSAVSSAAWVMSKGKKDQMMKNTKVVLQKIGDKMSSIYDTGLEGSSGDIKDWEKRLMIQDTKKQENMERIMMITILGILVGAFLFAGIVVWTIISSKLIIFIATVLIVIALISKVSSI